MARSGKENPNLSVKVQAARQLFLYGDADGKRVLEPTVLAERVGCHPSSVWSYVKDWSREYENMLIQANNFELGTVLSDDDVKKFKSDLLWLTKQTSEVKSEVDLTEKVEERLYKLLAEKDFSPEAESRFGDLLEKFFTAVHTKSKLRTQWIAMEREWIKLSGIEGKMEIVQNAEKARAVGRVKIDLKREENENGESGLKVAVKKPAGGLFPH